MESRKTQRGFDISEFTDSYGEQCSLQKSSSAMEDMIWLGIDKPNLTVFENESMGKYINTPMPKTWMVSSRMHLTREMVAELLPSLQKFVDTGELT
jgi:hypothetical protein